MAEESLSRSSSAKRFGIGFSRDKEGKSKAGGGSSTKRSVKNFWGIKKHQSMKHTRTAGSDDAFTVAKPENSPPKVDGNARKRSDHDEPAEVPSVSEEVKADEVKEVIKEEVKDFANRGLYDQTDSPLLPKDDENTSHVEQKPAESTPSNSLSVLLTEPKEKSQDLMAKAMDELQSILHRGSDHEDKKKAVYQDHEQRGKLQKGQGKKEEKVVDENTALNEIRAPTLFQRAKEEAEAVADAIRHKIEADDHSDGKKAKNNDHEAALLPGKNREKEKEEGCEVTLARGLQKICAPWSIDKDDHKAD